MFPSLWFVFLFAAGCFLSLVEGILIYYNAVLVALLGFDFIISRRQPFTVEREFDYILSIGVENLISLTIQNRSKFPLSLTVRDEYPAQFQASPKEVQGKIPGYETEKFSYSVVPYKRGEYSFGNVFTRRMSRLRLWVFEDTIPA
ncbi:MAG: hypothetical protein HXS54_18880, partial [Theionarchaea archaeon]|nr:hypothetical protein [Theionarchaea archaeon]